MRGQTQGYMVGADDMECCRESYLNSTAVLHRIVTVHDPVEREELLALRGALANGVEYIDRLIARDEWENREHQRALAHQRDGNGQLEGTVIKTTPATNCQLIAG